MSDKALRRPNAIRSAKRKRSTKVTRVRDKAAKRDWRQKVEAWEGIGCDCGSDPCACYEIGQGK